MLQIRTEVNGVLHYLDLYKDEEVRLSVSFNEVQDITKKNSPFSKTFKLPGSKKNNDIFNHFYRTQSSTFDFDPQQKFEAQLVFNGYELYKGYLRLNGVTRTDTDIIYNVTFYSQVGDLVSNIQDKYLSDLQLYTTDPNEYIVDTYPFNLQNQWLRGNDPDLSLDSANSSSPLYNGKMYFPLLNRGLQYITDTDTDTQEVNAAVIPRLRWNKPPFKADDLTYWDSDRVPPIEQPARQVPRTYLTGCLRIKDIYESVFRENGYSINSDFFNTAYFNRYYLPLTVSNEGFFPVQSVQGEFEFGSVGATSATSITYACTNLLWHEAPLFINPISVDRLSTANYTVDTDNFHQTDDGFLLNRNGTYIFKITFDYVSNDDSSIQFSIVNQTNPIPAYDPCFNSGETVGVSSIVVVGASSDQRDNIVEIQVDTFNHPLNYYAMDFIKPDPADDVRITRINVEVTQAPAFTVGNTYNPISEFVKPDVKQLDFVSGINKLFNLLVIPEPENPTVLRVEPIIDWIGKGETLDWSDKVDRSKPITVEPLTNIINGTLDYTYADDGSSTNGDFKKLNNRVFGSNVVTLETDYRDKVTAFNNIFSAQGDVTLNSETSIQGFTIPVYYTTETQDNEGLTFVQFKPYKTPPKLLFRQPVLPVRSFRPSGTNWWSLDGDKITQWSSNNRYSTYPFGVSGLTHATVWNKQDRLDNLEYPLNGYEDLYDVYYKDYILDLVNPDNRIVQCEMVLTPEDVRNLKFNEKIYLDGNIYRINKIDNYSLTDKSTAKVQLIKLTREYEGHRVRYYDLINCTGGTDLHTSTDHNYSIYFLKGYNVSVDGICYTVSAGTYNSGYTYQTLDIYNAYTDCTCGVSIDEEGVDPYDELFIPPTPTPTPTNPCGGCTYYEWENESPYLIGVTYRDCDTQLLVSDSVGGGQIYTACTCNSYTPIFNGGNLRENFSEPCVPSVTPSPTPTPSVTATNTPTPSVTPSLTRTPNPTPTVTRTATVTPTPSPSFVPAEYSYEIVNCDDPGDIRCVGSDIFYPNGKVVKISCCVDLCFTVLGPCETIQIDQIVSDYNSCGSCPR